MKELFLLRPDMVFLNHGSFGACPQPVFAVYQQWQRELEAQPVEFLGRRVTDLLATARARLATYVGAGPAELVFVPNATTAINTVARSVRLQPGDAVLATDLEYGAVDRTWQFLCARAGATYVRQPIPLPVTTPEAVVEALWQGVTPRTRAICLSHITSATALILPVAAICRRARQAGILTIVDGAHAPGQLPLDLAAIGADFYAGNCHKWLCAPKGAAFLYVRPEAQAGLDPLVVSWGWQADGSAPFVDVQEWQGTRDIAAYLSVPAAIEFQAAHDWPRVRAACHALLQDIRRRLQALTGLPPICPDSPQWYAQMASSPLPPCDGRALQARLWDEARIEVPIGGETPRPLIRVSIQAYNTPADGDALLAALAAFLPPGPA
ncbi:MAG TPA: aminotransferase class V-fold PLP-dependent enzyme [Chloroflexia bacterium]|nr:aminotransferase class V-fold PLP-dependent enzyme [Chloroflexia bacterium]